MNKNRGCLFSGVIIGLVLIVVLTVVIFNNEGRAVNRAKALEHIDEAVEVAPHGTDNIEDGTLVILSSMLSVDETLIDETFEVSAPSDTIKMRKSVSMYQWIETSETDEDDNTTYEYSMGWSTTLEDSSDFAYELGHENPDAMIYSDDDYVVDTVMMGQYSLEDEFVNQLNNYKPYKNLEMKITNLYMSVNENVIFISANGDTKLSSPGIGDYKIEYEIVSIETITVVGAKSGNNIISYHTKNGNLAEVSYGVKDKAVLKQEKIDENNRLTWAIRIGSIVGLMIAFGLLFSPITKLLGRVPLLGNIVNGGVFFVSAVLGGAWGVLVAAVGWLYYKPFIAIALIAVVVGAVILLSKAKQDESEQTPVV